MGEMSTMKPGRLQAILETLRKLDKSSYPTPVILFLVTVLTASSYSTYSRVKSFINARNDRKEARNLHRQNSSLLLNDGWRKQILVSSVFDEKNTGVKTNQKDVQLSRVVITPTKSLTFESHKGYFLDPSLDPLADSRESQRRGRKSAFDTKFIRQFQAIWLILLPKIASKTSLLLLLHAFFLILRTWLSLVIAGLDGRIVRDLVGRNGKQFLLGIGYWILMAFPASYTNSAIKYLQRKISIDFRTKLVRYVHDIYLDSSYTYYKVSNLGYDNLENIDQYITTDISNFCSAAAALYSSLGKPAMDFILFSYQLQKSLGPLSYLGIFGNYLLTALVLKRVSPPFGKLTTIQAKNDGEYRALHTRIITNNEEIAFYNGSKIEKSIIERSFAHLIHHLSYVARLRFSYNILEDFIVKYTWSALGYVFASLPVFLPELSGTDGKAEAQAAEESQGNRERLRMKQFIVNKRLMLSLADAGSRMMYSIKDLSELAGYTSRVFLLLRTLHEVHSGSMIYSVQMNRNRSKSMHTGTSRPPRSLLPSFASFSGIQEVSSVPMDTAVTSQGVSFSSSSSSLARDGWQASDQEFDIDDIQGTVQSNYNGIRLERVPIVAPGTRSRVTQKETPGTLLIRDMTFTIEAGDNLLVYGPNGVGKSSISRILAGLWPVYRGLVSTPSRDRIMFIPQRAYLSNGTLRDQIIYPDSHGEMVEYRRYRDEDLMKILQLVGLEYLPAREGGFGAEKEWKDVLSGGERQKIAFARIFYHKVKFVILDEATSAISSDYEVILFELLKKQSITYITLSHRQNLVKFHRYMVVLGTGEDRKEWEWQDLYEVTDVGRKRKNVSEEIKEIEEKLSHVEEYEKRRALIEDMIKGKVPME